MSFVGGKIYCEEPTPSETATKNNNRAEDNHLVSATVNCHPFNSFMFVPSEITHSKGLIKNEKKKFVKYFFLGHLNHFVSYMMRNGEKRIPIF